ncbi:MAG: CapA family protein [Caldilineaceae bacterium]
MQKQIPQHITLIAGALLILSGAVLLFWLIVHLPGGAADAAAQVAIGVESAQASANEEQPANADLNATAPTTETAVAPAALAAPLVIGVTDGLPLSMLELLHTRTVSETNFFTAPLDAATVTVQFDYSKDNGEPIYAATYAAATRFDTLEPKISWSTLKAVWEGEDTAFTAVAILTPTLPALTQVLGQAGATVQGYATVADVIDAAWRDDPTVALLPFDELDPRLVVLAIDGQNPIENRNKFDAKVYPLVATVYAHPAPALAADAETRLQELLDALPAGNRDPDRLTVIAMTGVTAMVRLTAEQMDKRGNAWPAEVVGPELAAADITAISNEVPFVPGCETNTNKNNLTFCSKPEYMEALTASGVDIIGLTGNHQNDYGREDALVSLDIYEKAGLPVYGGGRNRDEAFAPLYLEHNSNQLAFLGANSYGPQFAWATDNQPGSAPFDLNIMSATIRAIKTQGRAAVVLAELQYQESYDVVPLVDQRQNFNALVRAGADIVTGVQSHVPQAIEFTDGKLILYGLGNLYFDQMWGQTTREGMIVKHTIYNNRHISTQVLTTLLYDYGQPRWTTPEERKSILDRVFGASYWQK